MSKPFSASHLHSKFSITSVAMHLLIWLFLTTITFGLAVFIFPYYMIRYCIDQTQLMDENDQVIGQLKCTIDFPSIVGNVIIWAVLSFLTLGLAYFIYLYKIYIYCLSNTWVVTPDHK